MSRLKVAFGDVYMGFHETDYLFKQLFMKRYNAVETSQNPDIVFFNHRKWKWKQYAKTNAIKVFISGEPQPADHHPSDFSFTCNPTDNTNYFLPGFVRDRLWFEFQEMRVKENRKQKFCHFIYHNNKAKERINFCKALMAYKHVDCPGRVLNNMPNFTSDGRQAKQWRQDKIKFIRPYKFAIAYENVAKDNYITEKLFHAYIAGNVPIYWGASNIKDIVNPDSIINARDFTNNKELAEYVEEIDNNDELYWKHRAACVLLPTSLLTQCTEENILKRFDKIVEKAKRRR